MTLLLVLNNVVMKEQTVTLSLKKNAFQTVNVVVAVDYMDITKGSLDDISRPASSERSQAGSRESFSEIRRASRDGHRSLEVLSPDVKDTTVKLYIFV